MRLSNPNRWSSWVALLLACLVLAGCGGSPLYSALEERQANEMMGALIGSGIQAKKKPSATKVGWDVVVAESDIPQAMAVLEARGLPRQHYQTLGDIFKKEGFASSATDERGRYIHGLQQEISHTLSMLPGVANARVHIALPERDPLGGSTGKTSAAVWIFEQPGASVRDREADIKIVVKDGVEGLTDINQVSVKFVAMPAPPEAGQSGGTAMALSAVSPLAIGIAAAVVVIIALLLAFGSRLRGRSAVPAEPAPKRWQG
ncbi:EscJ/YscJ/HrcJ family type III secretion inner membrane ring protein [Luteimonas sp. S4-F44]|uniref:EscJ/YscJ/HrcJ family type III secretion inner membrane ring protein n=1 Tax=Luteimonas sp. S4-F44 TaxID=2925842 RepID=UPI001F52ECE0|nr:EscJ/YscJ/HrcJ family type III secretion inner membrane ring protein [Luteimonas sp. S4-F44]UNK42311.1 EscJ/YscJ/HrcJ family type III secretion inner membrane ring protein [Luteimonas sp. S4-F44]